MFICGFRRLFFWKGHAFFKSPHDGMWEIWKDSQVYIGAFLTVADAKEALNEKRA